MIYFEYKFEDARGNGFMELIQSTEIRQELHLNIELQQGISILGMSASDLTEHVKQCVEENPFLDDNDLSWPQHPKSEEEFKSTISIERFQRRGASSQDGERAEDEPFDQFSQESSLAEDLLGQFRLLTDSEVERNIGEFIIDSLDENGYLRISVEDIARILGVDANQTLRVLRRIQHLEPIGVGSRNLSECLAIQLEARGELSGPALKILEGGLPEFGKASPAQIAKERGVTLEEIDVALDILKTCDPRPGARLKKPSSTIWPEVVVEKVDFGDETGRPGGAVEAEGDYRVYLQDLLLPHLQVNEYYRTIAKTEKNKNTEQYLTRKLKEAESLIDNIRYRKEALFKIACCIVELQLDFFDRGIDYLQSLTMDRVAALTGFSPSTVSRISNGNYMQTPRGVFELRFFFQPAASSDGASTLSQASVKHRLKALIRQEDPYNPLSDQEIANRFKLEAIPISRRTVGKYRAELNILPRSLRKRA